MPQFLAVYDYGMGGIWLYVEAPNAAQVVERYPALTVIHEPPPWWTPKLERETRAKVGDPFWTEWLDALPRCDGEGSAAEKPEPSQ